MHQLANMRVTVAKHEGSSVTHTSRYTWNSNMELISHVSLYGKLQWTMPSYVEQQNILNN